MAIAASFTFRWQRHGVLCNIWMGISILWAFILCTRLHIAVRKPILFAFKKTKYFSMEKIQTRIHRGHPLTTELCHPSHCFVRRDQFSLKLAMVFAKSALNNIFCHLLIYYWSLKFTSTRAAPMPLASTRTTPTPILSIENNKQRIKYTFRRIICSCRLFMVVLFEIVLNSFVKNKQKTMRCILGRIYEYSYLTWQILKM